jgi:glycerol kinase
MYDDSGVRLSKLQVDGGMASNKLFLQMLANIVGINVTTPNLLETTALGVALAAGKAKGIDLFKLEHENEFETNMHTYVPQIEGKSKVLFRDIPKPKKLRGEGRRFFRKFSKNIFLFSLRT